MNLKNMTKNGKNAYLDEAFYEKISEKLEEKKT